MKITSITPQVKREGRYSIFVDGEYAFSLSAEGLLDAGFTAGQELSQVKLTEAKRQSQVDKAYNLALAYVARRMRSEGELRDYFRRKDYEPELAEQLISRLTNLGFVDDLEFAKRWVENRRLLRSSSTKKLRLELRQKHIAAEIISAIFADSEEDELHALRSLVEKKRKQTRYQDEQKLIAYLARQGFSYSDIKAALIDG